MPHLRRCWRLPKPVHLFRLLHLLPRAHWHTPTALLSYRPWRYWQHPLGLRLAQRMPQLPEHWQQPLPPPPLQAQQMRSLMPQPIVQRPRLMLAPAPFPTTMLVPKQVRVLIPLQRPIPIAMPLPVRVQKPVPMLVLMLVPMPMLIPMQRQRQSQIRMLAQQKSQRWLVAPWKLLQPARSPPGR